jgi:hypothetical protein
MLATHALPYVSSATTAILLFPGMRKNAREVRQRGETETERRGREKS